VAIAAGAMHTCAITTDGIAECWGLDTSGELGGGIASPDCATGPCSLVPRPVATTLRFDAIVAGQQHTCATSSGRLWCWGLNERGQLGSAFTGERCDGKRCSRTPRPVAGLSDVTAATAGGSHTCAVTGVGSNDASAAWCWGDNSHGQLGVGQPLSLEFETPVRVASTRHFVRLTSGAFHTCGLDDANVVTCWGDGSAGQLGADLATRADVPLGESGGRRWRAVAASARTTCGVTDTGVVYCWGFGGGGRLGTEVPQLCDAGPCSRLPLRTALATHPRSVVVGGTFACASGDDGVECWGDGMASLDEQLEGAAPAPQVDSFRSRTIHALPVRVNGGRAGDPVQCRADPVAPDRPPS
jgi:alpha-tubulin suppressor-like RCC1 family protein